MANAYGDAMTMAPHDLRLADYDPCQGRRMIVCRADARVLRHGSSGKGMDGRGRDRCQDQRGHHGKTEKQIGKSRCFHKNDPPLIVELIVAA